MVVAPPAPCPPDHAVIAAFLAETENLLAIGRGASVHHLFPAGLEATYAVLTARRELVPIGITSDRGDDGRDCNRLTGAPPGT